ncbi:MAG: molybdate ABC transporter substrate-binding protein [Actinomycetota bacterium]
MRLPRSSLILLAFFALLTGCSREPGRTPAAPTTPAPAISGSATVFAAASLAEAFNEAGRAFSRKHPGASIIFNFGASSTLATQIIEQGGADVFASADEANMKKVADKSLLEGASRIFTRNRLEIVVEPGNPKGIERLEDLAGPNLKVVLAAPQVPVGRFGREALARAGVEVKPVSEEPDVKAVLSKVTLGEADAGIVYRTDVKAAGDKVVGVGIPEAQNVVATYPIAAVKGTKNLGVAEAFIGFVFSEAGQKILAARGFIVGM